jgi:hypothetical protein
MERSMNDKFEQQAASIQAQREFMEQQFQISNANVRRFGSTITSAFSHQQRQHQQRNERNELFGSYGTIERNATLHPRPWDLYELWKEWTQGLEGRKAAKDFTIAERNNRNDGLKQKFYRRLFVWKTQARLIDGGMSLIAANTRIVEVTGASTITAIINKLIAFKALYRDRGGRHPRLSTSP